MNWENKKERHSPKAWHWSIFVRPSLTMEPDDDGWVVNRGGCNWGWSGKKILKKIKKNQILLIRSFDELALGITIKGQWFFFLQIFYYRSLQKGLIYTQTTKFYQRH